MAQQLGAEISSLISIVTIRRKAVDDYRSFDRNRFLVSRHAFSAERNLEGAEPEVCGGPDPKLKVRIQHDVRPNRRIQLHEDIGPLTQHRIHHQAGSLDAKRKLCPDLVREPALYIAADKQRELAPNQNPVGYATNIRSRPR